jgi:hypothetical protein
MNLDNSLIDQIIQGMYSVCFIYLMCANLLPVIDILRQIPKKKYYQKYLKKKYEKNIILWIANYKRKPTVPHDLWQKTCKYSHPSFKGKIDFNLLHDERIGLEDLILR